MQTVNVRVGVRYLSVRVEAGLPVKDFIEELGKALSETHPELERSVWDFIIQTPNGDRIDVTTLQSGLMPKTKGHQALLINLVREMDGNGEKSFTVK